MGAEVDLAGSGILRALSLDLGAAGRLDSSAGELQAPAWRGAGARRRG